MLAFARIPTATATSHGLEIDEVNSRLVKPAIAPIGIGADNETGSGCLTIGVQI
jgi:hypothetical protein